MAWCDVQAHFEPYVLESPTLSGTRTQSTARDAGAETHSADAAPPRNAAAAAFVSHRTETATRYALMVWAHFTHSGIPIISRVTAPIFPSRDIQDQNHLRVTAMHAHVC